MGILMNDAKIRSLSKGNIVFSAREDRIFHELDQQFLHKDRYCVFLIERYKDKCRLMDGLR